MSKKAIFHAKKHQFMMIIQLMYLCYCIALWCCHCLCKDINRFFIHEALDSSSSKGWQL